MNSIPGTKQARQVSTVLVLGGGSAGLLVAMSLKCLLPHNVVKLVHSKEIGVIGVGEGTTALFPLFLFDVLGISKERFYREAMPTWKQGIRFLWGERGDYFYDFAFQYDQQFPGMSKATGFYADENCDDLSEACAMMRAGKAFASGPLNKPLIRGEYAFHVENAKLVSCLTNIAIEKGVQIEEDTLTGVELDEHGVRLLHFQSGKTHAADLFIDATGFRSELIGKALGVPLKSFSGSLFCDRAVIGGWVREQEPLQAYTTAETMNAGWCWQIEHEHFINRGYVYAADFLSDDQAEAEFRAKNPRLGNTRIVKFRSGRMARSWEKNVVAIGNSSGFVEPLEATALAQIIFASRWLVEMLKQSQHIPGDAQRDEYNLLMGRAWDEIRDFLAFHYKFNTLCDTPFWKHCQTHTSLGDFQDFFDRYQKIGPSPDLIGSLPYQPNIYGIEGYLVHLLGMRVPFQAKHLPSNEEKQIWEKHRSRHRLVASRALTCQQALHAIRQPHWRWT